MKMKKLEAKILCLVGIFLFVNFLSSVFANTSLSGCPTKFEAKITSVISSTVLHFAGLRKEEVTFEVSRMITGQLVTNKFSVLEGSIEELKEGEDFVISMNGENVCNVSRLD